MTLLVPYKITKKPNFIGRLPEKERLISLVSKSKACIIVMYGRRRVGKTELIEQTFADYNLLKFEGLERQGRQAQLNEFARWLAIYGSDPALSAVKFDSWTEAFSLLANYVSSGRWTIYLEELQWMANYDSELVSSLKSIWDNQLRHNPELTVILCGSAPSFMINKVLRSAALYNRSEVDFPLAPFTLPEVQEFFGPSRSPHEIMDAILTVGALPPYLEKLKDAPSVFLGLAENSFRKKAYFSTEYERIFTSSLASNPHYRQVLEFLSDCAYAERKEILAFLKKEPGGKFSDLLEDLEQTGFIHSYSSPQSKPNSRIKRYEISDPYLRFYHKFIAPNLKEIEQGLYERNPQLGLDLPKLRPWLGFSFERWLRQNPVIISRLLGFDGIKYRCGAYFNRSTSKLKPASQIDLLFERADKYVTAVEVKYTETPVGVEVIPEFEEKMAAYPLGKRSLQRVLVSAAGIDQALLRRTYFDRVITLEELFAAKLWD